jgi:hypothetical protein
MVGRGEPLSNFKYEISDRPTASVPKKSAHLPSLRYLLFIQQTPKITSTPQPHPPLLTLFLRVKIRTPFHGCPHSESERAPLKF